MDNILKTLLRSHEYFSKYLFVKVMNIPASFAGFFLFADGVFSKIYKQE